MKALRKLGMDASSLLDEPEHMPSDPRGNTGGTLYGGNPRAGGDRFGAAPFFIEPKIEEMPPEVLSSRRK